MRGLPSTKSWVEVSITTLFQRNRSPVSLRNGQTLSVSTSSLKSKIIVSPIMIESTRLTEGAISIDARLVSGKIVYDLTPANCNAKFDYQIYEYYKIKE